MAAIMQTSEMTQEEIRALEIRGVLVLLRKFPVKDVIAQLEDYVKHLESLYE